MKKFLLILMILVLLIGCSSFKTKMFLKISQGNGIPPKTPIHVPFSYASSHTIIIDPILDKYPCHFIFDTGGVTMMDNKMADSVAISEVKTLIQDTKIGKIKETNLNGLIVKDMFYMLNPFADTFKASTKPIYGMIGSNFIRFFNTTIDYHKKELVFNQIKRLKKDNQGSHLLKMKIILPYFPTVKAKFNGHTFNALIDTGLNLPFVLPLSQMKLLTEQQRARLIKTDGYFCKWPFTESTDNYFLKVDHINIGDIVVKDAIIVFADLPPMIKEDTFLIGKHFLENYDTTLNFNNKQVLFTENTPSNNDLSYSCGLNIIITNGEYSIRGINDKSPAQIAGLTLETKVFKINGLSPDQTNLESLQNLLYDKNTHEITLTLKDNKELTLKKEKI